MIFLKTAAEIAIMRQANVIVAEILAELATMVRPGRSTAELEEVAARMAGERGARPAFKGYRVAGRTFPAALCASINEEVVHGIPSDERKLKEGDVISLDFGVEFRGFYGDAAVTLPVGKVSQEANDLLEVTRSALASAVDVMRVGARIGDISAAVQRLVEERGFSVVRDFVGHGIGKALHEDPQVPNFGEPNRGIRLKQGMVLAIEPMVNAGAADVCVRDDGWTAVTRDGSLSAHFEHSVAVTNDGPCVLSQL